MRADRTGWELSIGMIANGETSSERRLSRRRSRVPATAVAVVVSLVALVGGPANALEAEETSVASTGTGFTEPFAGPPEYEPLAATQNTDPSQLHQPLGQERAEEIALAMGLSPEDAFTPEQYLAFISGGGVGGDAANAKLVSDSAQILTNTVGRPMLSDVGGQTISSVLASYGLYVNESGVLMSPANTAAPTRQVNSVIAPGGYLGTWCRANGCEATVEALYRSAYNEVVVFGLFSQLISGEAQLVPNTKDGVGTTVGMSMAPTIWLTNFALLYLLNPEVAAAMPAYWAPIPPVVADAIEGSPNGQVAYCDYASLLEPMLSQCPAPTPPPTPTTTTPAPPPVVAPVVTPRFTG